MLKNNILLQVKDLKKYFPLKRGILYKGKKYVYAVDKISFSINQGETLGLVGESGCGKTTTGRTIVRLIEPTGGEVYFKRENIFGFKGKEITKLRRNIQIIFQDPFQSLNPRMNISDIVGESLLYYKIVKNKREKEEKVIDLLNLVGLNKGHIKRYPHEFSGGQRQRIGIARALALNPKLIICDEPISALDVSIQAQIINLLKDLQEKIKLTYLFIAHDLSVVKNISNRVAIMYLGKIIELASTYEIFNNPKHPYTEALLSSIPIPDPTYIKQRIILEGDIPSPINPPNGCYFNSRCRYAKEICREEKPELINIKNEHYVACHLVK